MVGACGRARGAHRTLSRAPADVAFTDEGRLVGDAAKNQLTSNPENTVFDAKRLIGREWGDKSVQKDKEYFPFELVEKNGRPHVQVQVGVGALWVL